MSNWNAADAIPWYLAYFGPDAQYMGSVDGFESVALKLKDEFVKAGGEVHLNCELRSFNTCTLADHTTGIELRFFNGSIVRCRRLILAMPRRSLELLDQTNSVRIQV